MLYIDAEADTTRFKPGCPDIFQFISPINAICEK